MNPTAEIAAIADEIEAWRPDLAERLRDAMGGIGRPENEILRAHLNRARKLMKSEIATGRKEEDVVAEYAKRDAENRGFDFWFNVLKGKRKPGYFSDD